MNRARRKTDPDSVPREADGPLFSVTPFGAIDDVVAKLMRPSDHLVLCVLGAYRTKSQAWWTYPMRQTVLARRLNMSRETVSRAITRLEYLGWVVIERNSRKDRPSRYFVKTDFPANGRSPGTAPRISFADFKAGRGAPPGVRLDCEALLASQTPQIGSDEMITTENPDRSDHPDNSDVIAAVTPVTYSSHNKSPDPLLTETRPGGELDRSSATDGAEPASGQGKAAPLSEQAMAGLSRQPGPDGAGGNIAKGSAGRPEDEGGDSASREAHPQAINGEWRRVLREKIGAEAARRDLMRCNVSRDGRVLTCQCPFHARDLAERYGPHLAEFFHAVVADGAPPLPLR